MEFPPYSDLDGDQRSFYSEAPVNKSILIIGPPGTGKTVMAFHRAGKLAQLGQNPHVVMYNSVLAKYAAGGSSVAPEATVSTMESWLRGWWKKATGSKHPEVQQWIPDWDEIFSQACQGIQTSQSSRFGLGHLIIDEGQDFPSNMYSCLNMLIPQLAAKNIESALTVFADENQRIKQDGSRIKDIKNNLGITSGANRMFILRKNHRNTRPIAEFAQYFQVGNTSGVAELPEKDGEKPQIVFTDNSKSLPDFIARKVKMNPGASIGVLVSGYNTAVKKIYNKVTHRFKNDQHPPIAQMYLSGRKFKDFNDARKLDFNSDADNKRTTITFLNQQSGKGLEFDIVFYLGMEGMDESSSGFLNERMAIYVMSSRARKELYIAFQDVDPNSALPTAAKLLPRPNKNLCRYLFLDSLKSEENKFLNVMNQNTEYQTLDNDIDEEDEQGHFIDMEVTA